MVRRTRRRKTRTPTQMPTMAVMVMRGGSGELGVSEGEELGWAVEVGVLDWLLEVDVLFDGFEDRLVDRSVGLSVDEEAGGREIVAIGDDFVVDSESDSGASGSGVALGLLVGGAFEGDGGSGSATGTVMLK
jgi:hypothetical protein